MPLIEAHLGDEKHLQDIADIIAASHKVLVVTGAGISTSIGIPDFRSKDGLYNLIPESTLPSPPPSEPATPIKTRYESPVSTPSRKRKAEVLEDDDEEPISSQSSHSGRRSSMTPTKKLRGQDLFDSRVFQDAASTTMFYRFIASLREKIYDEVKDTSGTHKFIKTLRDGGRLMRCYTQNIDCLESREGLVTDLKRGKGNKRRFMKKNYEKPRESPILPGSEMDGGCEVVQLHGELDTLRCSVCSTQWTWTENETEVFMDGFAPRCKKCAKKSLERQETGKRGLTVGSLRPNIVLYGEDHPQNTLLSPFVPYDASCQPDVLIIMGTSLKVFGLQKIIREFAKAVHGQKKGKVIFVNRTRPAESVWDSFIDYFVPMDCDDWVIDLRQRRADIWLRQGEIGATMKVSKPKKRKSEPVQKQKGVEVVIPLRPQSMPPKKAAKQAKSARGRTPATPRHARELLRKNVLSPLMQARRPVASPLSSPSKAPGPRKALTPTKQGPFIFRSPKRPDFSPITPAIFESSSLRNVVTASSDTSIEIQESEHEKENLPEPDTYGPETQVDGAVPETPTKARYQNMIEHLINKETQNDVAFDERVGGVSGCLVPGLQRRSSGRQSAMMKSPR
ncbi:NAD-dependent histone deacetylase HST3 [Cyphellophora attinorum]|uniref:NAD-dependent histone deacetylase HST3 n=1 Tax=Cyphellophora attinorum TaxID=1664694 RepID=A0A0N1P069_9EURO|nr:NAD-dependent histone deacetylase HST3 [Phialophora attinorum]KPI41783.1 NAD-dependent histone deacetylase HST3 [Phialophora attinorum]